MKDEYELLHQFEVVFRDGEHRTQAATRDYQQVWKNVIDNPPEDGVTPVLVYRQNGEVCAAIAGMDDLIDNVECSMEIARLAARVKDLEAALAEKDAEIAALREAIRNLAAEIDRHDIRAQISDTNIHWFKRLAIEAIVGQAADEEKP